MLPEPPQTEPVDADPRTVRGLLLRSVLVTILREHGAAMTVAQLGDALSRRRLTTQGRPSKAISDALRWELRRGRVVRVARSTYAVGHVARSTAWRMRQRTAAIHRPKEPPTDVADCRSEADQ